MALTLKPSAKITVDFEGTGGQDFQLTVTQPGGGSLQLTSATYNGETKNGPIVQFTLAAGVNAMAVALAFAKAGETGALTEVDVADPANTQGLRTIITRTTTTRVYFMEGL